MNKRKRMFSILLVLIFTVLVTGCKKEALTYEDFESKLENKEYLTNDISNQYNNDEKIIEAFVAEKDGIQLEYYKIATNSQAKTMFERKKEVIEINKTSEKDEEYSSKKNTDKYTLKTAEYYYSLTRIDNTYLYSKVKIENKDELIKIINSLGY